VAARKTWGGRRRPACGGLRRRAAEQLSQAEPAGAVAGGGRGGRGKRTGGRGRTRAGSGLSVGGGGAASRGRAQRRRALAAAKQSTLAMGTRCGDVVRAG
jgi:hypothetical protein